MAGRIPIDHTKIIDGFGELAGSSFYAPRTVYCGVCAVRFELSPQTQKDLVEVRGIPVKMLERRAAFCPACRPARSAANRARNRRTRHLAAIAHAQHRLDADARNVNAMLDVLRERLTLLDDAPNAAAAERMFELARRAVHVDPTRLEARYWEARALEAASRVDEAARVYEVFCAAAAGKGRLRQLVADAKRRIR